MLKTIQDFILASASPRRRQLLENLGLDFVIYPPDLDEVPWPAETPEEYVLRMAASKAESVGREHGSQWVLSADTTVIHADRILGKPGSDQEALDMLMLLRGREHEVRTGFCLRHHVKKIEILDNISTAVRFTHFDRELAKSYIRTGEPMDKAGAYGIQGLGGALVESVQGSYSNVVGLPLAEVISVLLKNDVITIL